MTFLVKRDIFTTYSLCGSNREIFLKAFSSVYFDKNVDIPARTDQFINAIESFRADNRIYDLMRTSKEHHELYIDLLVQAFIKSPLNMREHILSAMSTHVLPPTGMDRDLWQPHRSKLLNAIDCYPDTDIYHHAMIDIKNQWQETY